MMENAHRDEESRIRRLMGRSGELTVSIALRMTGRRSPAAMDKVPVAEGIGWRLKGRQASCRWGEAKVRMQTTHSQSTHI